MKSECLPAGDRWLKFKRCQRVVTMRGDSFAVHWGLRTIWDATKVLIPKIPIRKFRTRKFQRWISWMWGKGQNSLECLQSNLPASLALSICLAKKTLLPHNPFLLKISPPACLSKHLKFVFTHRKYFLSFSHFTAVAHMQTQPVTLCKLSDSLLRQWQIGKQNIDWFQAPPQHQNRQFSISFVSLPFTSQSGLHYVLLKPVALSSVWQLICIPIDSKCLRGVNQSLICLDTHPMCYKLDHLKQEFIEVDCANSREEI